jgi:predicted permease
VLHDLRYALRTFRREPVFVAGVVLTFAVAIGANAAMVGIVERLMLAPPSGVSDAGRVVRVRPGFVSEAGESYTMETTSYPAYEALASRADAFAAVAAERLDTMATGRGAARAEVAVVQATGSYFTTLGARPAIGSFFGPGDDLIPAGNSVVVLGHAYWRRRFASDRGVIGRELIVDDQPLTIIGVAPRGFHGAQRAAVDLFVPLTVAFRGRGPGWWSEGGMRIVTIVARLRGDVDSTAAGTIAAAALRASSPAFDDLLAFTRLESLVPGQSARTSPQARVALWLSGVSSVVLVLAAANVATLLLLRAARRRQEVGVRLALGASRARLARQSITESLLLAVAGGAGGLLVARWFTDAIRATLLPALAPSDSVADGTLIAASFAAAAGAGLLAGLIPLLHFRGQPSDALRAGGGHGSSGRFVVQHLLVGIQVALCTLLLVGAGLFVISLHRVRSQDLGFSTSRLLYVGLDFTGSVPGAERDLIHHEAVRRLAALPGVSRVTVVQGMPFASHHIPPIDVPGFTFPPGRQLPIMYGATPDYLEMMTVELRDGRLLSEYDDRRGPLVVLVNETMARTVWPGERAIGKCVRAGHPPGATVPGAGDPTRLPCREVVGIVRDSRARSLRPVGDEARLMQYYVPFEQLPRPPFADATAYGEVHAILVQAAGDPRAVAADARRTIQGSTARPVYARVRPYQELIDPQLRTWRLGATVFTAFGVVALVIAAIGLVAVISYLVAQRTREIGVRLALGGTSAAIVRLVVGDALRMAAGGATAGVLAGLALGGLTESMLFATSPRDPLVIASAASVLMIVAVMAATLPAWRAAQVSPLAALRTD